MQADNLAHGSAKWTCTGGALAACPRVWCQPPPPALPDPIPPTLAPILAASRPCTSWHPRDQAGMATRRPGASLERRATCRYGSSSCSSCCNCSSTSSSGGEGLRALGPAQPPTRALGACWGRAPGWIPAGKRRVTRASLRLGARWGSGTHSALRGGRKGAHHTPRFSREASQGRGGGSHYNPHCSLKAREEEEEDEAVRATLRDSEARERALPSFPVGLRKGRRGGEPEGRGRGGEDEGRTRGGREERPGRMRGTSKNVL